MNALTATTQKIHADNNCLFQSLYFHEFAETIIALHLPLFTKKGVSGLKQKK